MLRLPIYGNKTLKLAFEFGLVLSETASRMKIELKPEMINKAEDILLNELKTNGFKNTTKNFVPLILAVIEPK